MRAPAARKGGSMGVLRRHPAPLVLEARAWQVVALRRQLAPGPDEEERAQVQVHVVV